MNSEFETFFFRYIWITFTMATIFVIVSFLGACKWNIMCDNFSIFFWALSHDLAQHGSRCLFSLTLSHEVQCFRLWKSKANHSASGGHRAVLLAGDGVGSNLHWHPLPPRGGVCNPRRKVGGGRFIPPPPCGEPLLDSGVFPQVRIAKSIRPQRRWSREKIVCQWKYLETYYPKRSSGESDGSHVSKNSQC